MEEKREVKREDVKREASQFWEDSMSWARCWGILKV